MKIILSEVSYYRYKKNRPQKLHCKNFRWECIENEYQKSYLGNKEQKAKFPVVSQSDAHSFGSLM